MLYIITFTNIKKTKRLSKYFIRIYQHVMIPFSITMKTGPCLSNVVYGTLTKNWRKHKIYFYIYEDTKNIGT